MSEFYTFKQKTITLLSFHTKIRYVTHLGTYSIFAVGSIVTSGSESVNAQNKPAMNNKIIQNHAIICFIIDGFSPQFGHA